MIIIIIIIDYLLVHKIEERHSILGQIYGFWKREETESYDNAIYWRWALTVTVGALIVLEVATYKHTSSTYSWYVFMLSDFNSILRAL